MSSLQYPKNELEATLNDHDRENTVADLIAWLKTQDQDARVEVQIPFSTDKSRFCPVPWRPERTELMDFTDNRFAKGRAWEGKRYLLLGRRIGYIS